MTMDINNKINTLKYKIITNQRVSALNDIRFFKKITKQLEKEFADLIYKYQLEPQFIKCETKQISEKPIFWVCWLQGENPDSPLVRKCISNLREYNPNVLVMVLTEENLSGFIKLDEIVINRYKSGTLSRTQLSDIIRTNILSKHGGYWFDATIFTFKKLPPNVLSYSFVSGKVHRSYVPSNISRGRWTSYFMGAPRAGYILFRFISEFFNLYLTKYDKFQHYFLLDIVIYIAYRNIGIVREDINRIPLNIVGSNLHILEPYVNEKYDEMLFEKIEKDNVFQKLTYRVEEQVIKPDSFYSKLIC